VRSQTLAAHFGELDVEQFEAGFVHRFPGRRASFFEVATDADHLLVETRAGDRDSASRGTGKDGLKLGGHGGGSVLDDELHGVVFREAESVDQTGDQVRHIAASHRLAHTVFTDEARADAVGQDAAGAGISGEEQTKAHNLTVYDAAEVEVMVIKVNDFHEAQ
jgi:hypothetical protein